MTKRILCVIISIACLLSGYRAYGDDIKVTVDIGGNAANGEASIHQELAGKSYTEESWFTDFAAPGKAGSDEQFIMGMMDVCKKGSSTDYYELWPPDERAPQNPYTDATDLENLHARYRAITSPAFLQKIYYKEFTVFFVQVSVADDPEIVMIYPVVQQGSRYYKTSRLYDDPVFLYLAKTYVATIPRKKADSGTAGS